MVIDKIFGKLPNGFSFSFKKSAGANDLFNLFYFELNHFLRGVCFSKKSGCNLVNSSISTLSGEEDSYEECIWILMLKGDFRIWKKLI